MLFRSDGVAGANGVPSFTFDLYKDASGNWSTNNSTFSAAPYSFDIPVPNASNQIKFAMTDGTNLASGTLALINKSTNSIVARAWTTDGNVAVAKSAITAAGTYTLLTYPDSYSLAGVNYNLVVATQGATPVITDANSNQITTNSSNVYELPFDLPNFSFQLVHPNAARMNNLNVSPMLCDWTDTGVMSNCGAYQITYQDSIYKGYAKLKPGN